MDHWGHVEFQDRIVTQIESVSILHGDDIVSYPVVAGNHRDSLGIGDYPYAGIFLSDEIHAGGMVRLHVVHNEVVHRPVPCLFPYLPYIFFSKFLLDGIDKGYPVSEYKI